VLLNSILTCHILELAISYALTEYSNVNALMFDLSAFALIHFLFCFLYIRFLAQS